MTTEAQFLSLLQAGSNQASPEIQTAQNQILRLSEENKALFLQYLVAALASTSIGEAAMNFAVVLTRVCLPAKIRINEDPFDGLPDDLVAALMARLLALFTSDCESNRYHAAMSYGKFAAFVLSARGSSQYLDAVAGHLGDGDERVANSCVVVIDQIISYSRLTIEQKESIFRILFTFMCSGQCGNVTKELCMSALCQLGKDVVTLVRSDANLYLNSFLEMMAYPLIAGSGFLLFSDVARFGYDLLGCARSVAGVSIRYLQGQANEVLYLNILRFWCFTAQQEIGNENSLGIVAENIEKIVPLLFGLFEKSYSQWVSDDDWCIASASANAIVAVGQAEPQKFLDVMSPVISRSDCQVPILVQSVYAVLASGNESVIQKIIQPAMDTAMRAIQSQDARTIKLGFDVLGGLSSVGVPIASVLVAGSFRLLTCDSECVRESVVNFIDTVVSNAGESLPVGNFVEELFKLIMSTEDISYVCRMIDLLGLIIRSGAGENGEKLAISCIKPSLELCEAMIKKCPDDEPMEAALHLLMRITFVLPQDSRVEYADNVSKLVFCLQESQYRSSVLQLLGVIARVLGEAYRPLTEMTFQFLDKVLAEPQSANEVVDVFRCLPLFLKVCDVGPLIQPLVAKIMGLVAKPDLSDVVIGSAIEVLNVIMFYHQESMVPFIDSIVSCVDLAVKLISSPGEDGIDSNLGVNIVESCARLLKYNAVPGLMDRVIPITVHVLNLVPTFGDQKPSLVYFAVDVLVLLSQILARDDFAKLMGSAAIQQIKCMGEKLGDDKCKEDLARLFGSGA